MEAQTISCMVEPLILKEKISEIMVLYNTMEVFEQETSVILATEQHKDPVLSLVFQSMLAGDKLRPLGFLSEAKVAWKYPLQSDQLTLKKNVLHHLYIYK